MIGKRILFAGYGYTAQALAGRLRDGGWRLAATYRDDARRMQLEGLGVEPVAWRDDGIDSSFFDDVCAVLISSPPDETGCPAFRALEGVTARHAARLEWIGYLSSNGVYGNHDGEWVDEDSRLKPSSPRAKARVRAEADWALHAAAFNLPLVIFRLPGIYGPGRSAFDALREGRAQRIDKPGQVFSRAHVDDIAAALAASIERPRAGDLFNIADDEPAPPQDVVDFAAGLLGLPAPPLIPFESADLSPMARSFYDDNKRVDNRRMKERLGVEPLYPTYREGLRAILKQEALRGA